MKVIYNVSVPYEITLLSNSLIVCFFVLKFQYLMKLHYSQTEYSVVPNKGTVSVPYEITLLSNGFCRNFCLRWVSVPYEITLLSNQSFYFFLSCFVSVPYEITLLSNNFFVYHRHYNVSVPYEITLLSNHYYSELIASKFQYLMKLHYSQTLKIIKF